MISRPLVCLALFALLPLACGLNDSHHSASSEALAAAEASSAATTSRDTPQASRATPDDTPLRATSWLTLAAVDARGRRPLRPDVVLQRYLLDPQSPAPQAGDELVGELGDAKTWTAREVNDRGGPADAGRVAWAFTELHAPHSGVWLAQLSGAAQLIVNGQPVFGDYYGLGRDALPVLLRAGANSVFVHGVRGAFRLSFEAPQTELEFVKRNDRLPDLVRDRHRAGPVSLALRNAGSAWQHDLEVVLLADTLFEETRTVVQPGLAPLEVARVPIVQRVRDNAHFPAAVESWERHAELRHEPSGELLARHSFTLRLLAPEAPRRETFVSRLDGTVQSFGLREPVGAAGKATGAKKRASENVHESLTDSAQPALSESVLPSGPPGAGLVLSLHGASVGDMAQIKAYASQPDFWIVSATNRGKFGFDWQDWGREDAYEVLERALQLSGVARDRVMLTGHSMGGHGTWHLAANDPDGFAAVAPSAGWVSFDSYGSRPEGALRALWHAADAGSDTLALLDNLTPQPIFVLHGTADDNVPASEAQTMLDALRAAGASPGSHMQDGAGHWWDGDAAPGADCLTWPGIFELFRESERERAPSALSFTSVHPSVDSRHHWVSLLQPERYGERMHISGSWSDDGLVQLEVGEHGNVARLQVHRIGARSLNKLRVDGQNIAIPPGAREKVDPIVARHDGAWRFVEAATLPSSSDSTSPKKTPAEGGPFKRAFDERFVFVVGTAGDDAMDAALLTRARALATEWNYRASGRAAIVEDTRWLEGRRLLATPTGEPVGRPILLGNAETNKAWATLLGGSVPGGRVAGVGGDADSSAGGAGSARSAGASGGVSSVPLQVANERVFVGEHELRGDDLVAAFVAPTARGLVGAIGFSGVRATRVANVLAPFVSGAGFPDYLVFDSTALTLGDEGVRAAGWFSADWQLQDCAGKDCPPRATR
ncbi:MAG: hypothetical protein DHS20C15_12280 [Planctomycetota bacterium]|nr:MAG: hypothetical protein DHS20C15_12280 [Planctomycetota bacterium]